MATRKTRKTRTRRNVSQRERRNHSIRLGKVHKDASLWRAIPPNLTERWHSFCQELIESRKLLESITIWQRIFRPFKVQEIRRRHRDAVLQANYYEAVLHLASNALSLANRVEKSLATMEEAYTRPEGVQGEL